MTRVATVFAALLLALVTSTASGAEATVVPGDRISGRLGPGGQDTLTFALGAPASLHVKAKLAKEVRAVLHLTGPDGEAVVIADSYLGATSNKPRLKGVELRRLGTYRLVISQTSGQGDYALKLALKSPRPREVNLAGAPTSEPTMNIDADQVVFQRAGTALSAKNVQDAVEEVVDELRDVQSEVNLDLFEFGQEITVFDQTVADFGTSIDEIADDVTTTASEVDAAIADFASQVEDLDDRVDTFDGGGDLMRVLWKLDATQSVEATNGFVTAANRDIYRVRRHEVVSLTFGPDEIDTVVIADVKWDATPSFAPGSQERVLGLPGRITWGEVGGRFVGSALDGTHNWTQSSWPLDLYGVSEGGDPNSIRDYSAHLVYAPTAAERANGFTIVFYVSAYMYEEPSTGYEIDGFTVDVHTAVVFGR